jgi:hypothetical protein
MIDDLYQFLRPCASWAEAFCACHEATPVMLGQEVGHNPIRCMVCSWPVRPEDVPVPESLVSRLSQWSRLYSAFMELFLDAEEYQSWACSVLHDVHSRVNQDGLWLQKELSSKRPCFYLYVRPESMGAETCPNCSRPTRPYVGGYCRMQVCESCGIVMAD